VAQSLRFVPVGMFGAVMGLAGLGLACRAASPVLPVPLHLSEFWFGVAALVLAALFAAYVLKALRHFDAVREELANPALIGFCAALPVGVSLVAAGAEPHSRAGAQLLWWCCVLLMLALQTWALALLLRGRVRLAHVNGGWLIVLVGGIVMPFAGLPLGHEYLGTCMFVASAVAAPFVMGAILYRMVAGPALPPALRPSLFILLVPPSLIYVNGDTLWPGQGLAPLEWLYYLALPLAAALLFSARGFRSWPFGAPWWAFTFPLDALAGAAAHFAQVHPAGPWRPLAGGLLLLATIGVIVVLTRTLAALARGTLFAAPTKS
jgi:tellurite resistance protein